MCLLINAPGVGRVNTVWPMKQFYKVRTPCFKHAGKELWDCLSSCSYSSLQLAYRFPKPKSTETGTKTNFGQLLNLGLDQRERTHVYTVSVTCASGSSRSVSQVGGGETFILFRPVVLNLPNPVTFEYSSSCCADTQP